MRQQTIPARIRWGVDVMDVQPGDQLLEIGCGPGAAAELVCSRLESGKLFAIDRSESGVDRTKRRCAQYVEAGRLTVRQIDLATLRVPVKRLHKAFAFNVNLFWVRQATDEIALLHEKLLPGGRAYLFYEATMPEGKARVIEAATRALADGGFRVSVLQSQQPAAFAVIGQRVTAQD